MTGLEEIPENKLNDKEKDLLMGLSGDDYSIKKGRDSAEKHVLCNEKEGKYIEFDPDTFFVSDILKEIYAT